MNPNDPLAGGGQLPPEKMAYLEELNEAFNGDREMVAAYLTHYGWSKVVAPNIRYIKRIMAEQAAAQPTRRHNHAHRMKAQENEDGERDPFYMVELVCPFCGCAFTGAALRAKSLIITYTYKDPLFPLMVPEATGTTGKYHVEDPLCRSVIVCPDCLYAGANSGFFHHESTSSAAGAGEKDRLSRLPARKMDAIREAVDGERAERAELGRVVDNEELISQMASRSRDAALVSWALAGRCATLLATYDPIMHLYAAEAYLSAARLASDMERPGPERQCLEEARESLKNAFQFGGQLAMPVYLLGVVHWHCGDAHEARVWAGRILTDRGKLSGSQKYKRFAENLNESLKKIMAAEAAAASASPAE